MELSAYLSPDRVAVIHAANKVDAIRQTLELLKSHPGIGDFEPFCDAIWEREEALPTGIGLGIGVPHVRSDAIRTPVAALTIIPEGVQYDALDGEPVRVILLIAMPEGAHKQYLEYLSRATLLFMIKEFRNALLACHTPVEIWDVIEKQGPLRARM